MCMWTEMFCCSHSIVFGAHLLAIPLWRMCMCTQMFYSSHSIVFGAQLLAFPLWRMCMCTQMLYSSHYCFRCSVTCNSTAKNVYVHSNALLLPFYCYRCSITLLLHPLICVAEVWCARRGLPLKKKFCMDEGFCVTAKRSDWLQDSSDKCNSAPYRSIIRSLVSLVTYVLRTRTPSTVISCQPNSVSIRLYQQLKLKTKESGYSFHTICCCFKNACRRTGEPG